MYTCTPKRLNQGARDYYEYVGIPIRNTKTVPLRQTVRRGVKAVWQTVVNTFDMKQILRRKKTKLVQLSQIFCSGRTAQRGGRMESQKRVVFVSGLLNNRDTYGVKRLACFGKDRPDCLRHVHVVCCLALHADFGRSARHSWCSRVLHRKVVLVRFVACACTGCGGPFG